MQSWALAFPSFLHHVVTQVPQLQELLAVEAQRAVDKVVGAALFIESADLQNRLFSLAGAKTGFGLCGAWKPCAWLP